MERSINRPLIVLLAMIIGLTILVCLCYLTLFVQPNLPFNPLSPARATSSAATRIAQFPTSAVTLAAVETYPPTWTPSPTFTPGPTKTPTDTRTPTPTSTTTPTVTGTPTRTPTIVVPPTLTATPPYMYAGVSGNSENNCANIKLRYAVNGEDGEPVSGYLIEYGEIAVRGSVFQTEKTEFHDFYGVTLLPGTDRANAQRSHNWFAYLIKDGEKISKASLFSTDPMYALDSERCETNTNATATSTPESGCIPDPCTSNGAVNVKEIIWQPRVTGFIPIGTSTPRPNLCRPPYEDFVIPRTCSDCATQADAQRLFELVGGPRVDIYDFDRDGNGLACEHLP